MKAIQHIIGPFQQPVHRACRAFDRYSFELELMEWEASQNTKLSPLNVDAQVINEGRRIHRFENVLQRSCLHPDHLTGMLLKQRATLARSIISVLADDSADEP